MLFLAVQFVDILFFSFVLVGIEHFEIVENYTPSTHFRLDFMPYTHSLLASFLWAALIYIVFRFAPSKKRARANKIALVMALAVLSHWFLDLIVHTPDLPLLDDRSVKVGFGLWYHPVITYLLEATLLLMGLTIYLKSTTATTFVGKYGMIFFALLMLIVNAYNIFGPPIGNSVVSMSISGLVLYFVFAAVAFWLDGKRS